MCVYSSRVQLYDVLKQWSAEASSTASTWTQQPGCTWIIYIILIIIKFSQHTILFLFSSDPSHYLHCHSPSPPLSPHVCASAASASSASAASSTHTPSPQSIESLTPAAFPMPTCPDLLEQICSRPHKDNIYKSMTEKQKNYTLILDLDETLLHSSSTPPPSFDHRVEIHTQKTNRVFYVNKRPYLDLFLQKLSPYFELVVFTASLRRYGDAVLDAVDVSRVISRRFFRPSCHVHDDGGFWKDVSAVTSNHAKSIIIDNSPQAYAKHPHNAVPITTWYDDMNDTALRDLIPFLLALRSLVDVRSVLGRRSVYEAHTHTHHTQVIQSPCQQFEEELADEHEIKANKHT